MATICARPRLRNCSINSSSIAAADGIGKDFFLPFDLIDDEEEEEEGGGEEEVGEEEVEEEEEVVDVIDEELRSKVSLNVAVEETEEENVSVESIIIISNSNKKINFIIILNCKLFKNEE